MASIPTRITAALSATNAAAKTETPPAASSDAAERLAVEQRLDAQTAAARKETRAHNEQLHAGRVTVDLPAAAEALFNGDDARDNVLRNVWHGDGEERAAEGLTQDDEQALNARYRPMLQETGLGYGLGERIVRAHLAAEVAKRRYTRSERTDAEIATQNRDAREKVLGIYGRERGEELLARAVKFIQAHPTLRALASDGALEHDLEIINALVDEVHRRNYR